MENLPIIIDKNTHKYPRHYSLSSDPHMRYKAYNRKVKKEDCIEDTYINKLSNNDKKNIEKEFKKYSDDFLQYMITEENITDKIKQSLEYTCIIHNGNNTDKETKYRIAIYNSRYYILEHTRKRLNKVIIPLISNSDKLITFIPEQLGKEE